MKFGFDNTRAEVGASTGFLRGQRGEFGGPKAIDFCDGTVNGSDVDVSD